MGGKCICVYAKNTNTHTPPTCTPVLPMHTYTHTHTHTAGTCVYTQMHTHTHTHTCTHTHTHTHTLTQKISLCSIYGLMPQSTLNSYRKMYMYTGLGLAVCKLRPETAHPQQGFQKVSLVELLCLFKMSLCPESTWSCVNKNYVIGVWQT